MCPSILEILLSGKAPDTIRTAIARGMAPLPPNESLKALVFLTNDSDREIASTAQKTLAAYNEDETLPQLKSEDCAPSVLEYFGVISDSGNAGNSYRIAIPVPAATAAVHSFGQPGTHS